MTDGPAPADWLLHGGRIHTFDPERPTVDAIAIAGGRVVATGSEAELQPHTSAATRRTDLGGRTVLPGFCDTHMHLIEIAQQAQMVVAEGATTADDVAEAIRVHTGKVSPGHWIQGRTAYSAPSSRESAISLLPDRGALDRVAPEHPIFLYQRPDGASLNTCAVQTLGGLLGKLTADEWDPATGRISGPAVRLVRERVIRGFTDDLDFATDTLATIGREMLAMGITTIVDPGQPGGFADAWQLYQHAHAQGALRQRLRVMQHLDQRETFAEQLAEITGSPVDQTGGDDWLRAWGLKLILDGEFADAWMRPGEELPGSERHWYSADQLREVLELCADRGWPLTVHAMGGGAADVLLDLVPQIPGLRPGQVTIAHGFLIDNAAMRACRELQIPVSCHPTLAHMFAAEMRRSWGPLSTRAYPIASMIAAGVRVSGGSDALPCPPLFGAANAVLRVGADGHSLGESETVTPYQAIELFTRRAGDYVSDPRIGVLNPGAFADLTVWDEDPLEIAPDKWLDLRATMTVVAGVEAYGGL